MKPTAPATARHHHALTPTEVMNALCDVLEPHLTAPIYLDGLPADEGVTEYYTLTHTAGLMGQIQRGVITVIFCGQGIDPYTTREEELTRAINHLPEVTPIVWTPTEAPHTSYNHAERNTIITARVEYQFLTD